uniref:Immunoglobulin subtype domain-containing protein n=1 Tax=Pundamilia nyererei TaxID=303518 RepID=A0A3B4F245_9CICH
MILLLWCLSLPLVLGSTLDDANYPSLVSVFCLLTVSSSVSRSVFVISCFILVTSCLLCCFAKHVFNNDPVVFDNYEGRAELFGQNDSLLVKNVQHNDSGDYTAVTISGKEQKVAEYKVIVQDSVTPADLTVDPVSNSSDSCDLTVTCSTVDFNISSSFRCDGKNCSHAGEKDLEATKKFSSLIVYLEQDTIFCNHSNQVSWNQTMKVLKSYCEIETGENNVPSGASVLPALISVLFFLALFITLCFIMNCKFQCCFFLFSEKLVNCCYFKYTKLHLVLKHTLHLS